MKIASWNINSIRARTERLCAWLEANKPDVLCLQELKCQEDQFPFAEVGAAGYRAVVHGQKTYNGVAILAREEPVDVLRGLSDHREDPQSRVIAATVRGVRVVCLYAPNGQAVDSPAFLYKLEWFGRLRSYLETRHKKDEPLVLTGDFNVAPAAIDTHDPELWEGQTMFTQREREALAEVTSFGLVDTFRTLHPEESKFSWWDYRMLAFPKNRGLRIDHLFVTQPLAEKLVAADIDREARKGKQPSDHAPVWAEFAV
ncbi:MAG: exodeoxyribonuclease III [Myxococcota bacterium]